MNGKFGKFAERRQYLQQEFEPLLARLEEADSAKPVQKSIDRALSRFSVQGVLYEWERAYERIDADPDAAITSARSLVESVCKHILDEMHIAYEENGNLLRPTIEALQLAPDDGSESIFKQLLGGCQTIVGSIDGIRNKYSDAHGRGKHHVSALQRHAELTVNAAGTVTVFLIQTYVESNNRDVGAPTC